MNFFPRKLLSLSLIIFALYSVAWFSGAHIIKKQIVIALNNLNSENTKISFKDIGIAGYPFNWSINISDINTLFLEKDNITKLELADTKLDINILLRSLKISFNKNINLTLGEDFDYLTKYTISPGTSLEFHTEFNESLYKLALQKNLQISHILKQISSNAPQINISKNDLSNAVVNNLHFRCLQNLSNQQNNYNIILSFDSESQNPRSILRLANFMADISINLGLSESKASFIKEVIVNNFTSNFNNSTEFKMAGNLDFSSRYAMPKGSLGLSFNNYPELVDIISVRLKRYYNTEDFRMHLLNIITKASEQNNSDGTASELSTISPNIIDNNARFDIIFTEEGIKVGDKDLSEFSYLKEF